MSNLEICFIITIIVVVLIGVCMLIWMIKVDIIIRHRRNLFLSLFLVTFLFADERCYFSVDTSKLPDPAREIVFENLLARGLQGRNPSGQPRDITHWASNPDDSKRLVQGTFNETEITWFFNIPYVEFIGYNIGVNTPEQRVLDYLNSTDWYKVGVSSSNGD